MSSTKEITGGTGDVNPQTVAIVANINLVLGDFDGTTAVQLPVPRFPQKKGRAFVYEFLRVNVAYNFIGANFAIDSIGFLRWFLNETSGQPTLAANSFIAGGGKSWNASASLAIASYDLLETVDLTDGAGHGVLIGADSCALRWHAEGMIGAAGVAGTIQTNTQIFYRVKEVSIEEYVGIVQSSFG